MKAAVDLHIHSCLSPCAENDMTPGNIAGMAHIKGLDIIAVADHNAARNLLAVEACCAAMGVVLLPAIEVTTAEEVHALCYFPTVAAAMAMDARLDEVRLPIPHSEKLGLQQLIMDEDDNVLGEIKLWLPPAVGFTLDETVALAGELGGLVVPAHINRGSTGLLQALGFLPPDAGFAALEISPTAPAPLCDLGRYKILSSSDAHRLEDIAEREHFLELPDVSRQALFDALLAWQRRALRVSP